MAKIEVSIFDNMASGERVLRFVGEDLIRGMHALADEFRRVADQLERIEVDSEAVEVIRNALKTIDGDGE